MRGESVKVESVKGDRSINWAKSPMKSRVFESVCHDLSLTYVKYGTYIDRQIQMTGWEVVR